MKFTEALEQKATYGNSYTKDGKTFLIHVAPKKFDDLLNWLKNYDEQTTDDNIALEYSTDNEFQLYANMTMESRATLGRR